MNVDARAAADVLVIGTFIRILEAPPPAHVVNEYRFEIRVSKLNNLDKLFQRISSLSLNPLLPESTNVLITRMPRASAYLRITWL